MQYFYDLHIHTAASPCGDQWMTPHNIVNMAQLNNIDIIAITDHNSCGNCAAVMAVGKEKGLLVVPGMEIECMEEFHCIALFPSLAAAKTIETLVQSALPNRKNNIAIFGEQLLLDMEDEVVGHIEQFLLTATALSITRLFEAVESVGGILYPAHIDRNSYSVLTSLGVIPKEPIFSCLEISQDAEQTLYEKMYPEYRILKSSDAHYIENLCYPRAPIELAEYSLTKLIETLKNKSKYV